MRQCLPASFTTCICCRDGLLSLLAVVAIQRFVFVVLVLKALEVKEGELAVCSASTSEQKQLRKLPRKEKIEEQIMIARKDQCCHRRQLKKSGLSSEGWGEDSQAGLLIEKKLSCFKKGGMGDAYLCCPTDQLYSNGTETEGSMWLNKETTLTAYEEYGGFITSSTDGNTKTAVTGSISAFFKKCGSQLLDGLEFQTKRPAIWPHERELMRQCVVGSCTILAHGLLEFHHTLVYTGNKKKKSAWEKGYMRRVEEADRDGGKEGSPRVDARYLFYACAAAADDGSTCADQKRQDYEHHGQERGKDKKNRSEGSDNKREGDRSGGHTSHDENRNDSNRNKNCDQHGKSRKKSHKKKDQKKANDTNYDESELKASRKKETAEHKKQSRTKQIKVLSFLPEWRTSSEGSSSPLVSDSGKKKAHPNTAARKTSDRSEKSRSGKKHRDEVSCKSEGKSDNFSKSSPPETPKSRSAEVERKASPLSTIFNMFYEATPLSEKKTLKPSVKKHRYSALTVKDASKLIESLNAHKVPAESSHTSHLTERVSESSEEKKEEFRILLSGFAVAESVNKPGLRRSKKSVAIGRLKRAYEMEDVHFCEFPWNSNDSLGLFCVFDGHSGKECALAARRLIPEYLSRHLEGVDLNVGDDGQVGSAHSLKEVFEAVFLEVDQELCDYEYEGTTCTVVFLWRNSEGRRFVQAANVGDSTALLIRNEVAIPLTEKHHLNVDSEFNRVRMSGVNIHQGQTRLNGLAVSRALGDHFPKSVQCGIIALPSVSPVFELSDVDSFLILATDGLWDVICHQRSYEIIKNEASPKEMSELLLVTALSSVDCTDNVTTVVVKL